MLTFIAVVHVIVCILLISLVLLQDPKSSGGGAMFGGGSSNSLLGATGAVTFLTRLTRYSAIIFGITCLILTILSRPKSGSVFDTTPVTGTAPISVPANSSAPAAPESAPASAPEAAANKPAAPTSGEAKK